VGESKTLHGQAATNQPQIQPHEKATGRLASLFAKELFVSDTAIRKVSPTDSLRAFLTRDIHTKQPTYGGFNTILVSAKTNVNVA
jgi:hypothetical protein